MSAPLNCRRCLSPFEPVGANHTHAGLCSRCQGIEDEPPTCDRCGIQDAGVRPGSDFWGTAVVAFCEDTDGCDRRHAAQRDGAA